MMSTTQGVAIEHANATIDQNTLCGGNVAINTYGGNVVITNNYIGTDSTQTLYSSPYGVS